MSRTRVVKGKGPLKVLTIRTIKEVEMLQQQDFLSRFHVILASTKIHSSEKYALHIRNSAGCDRGLMQRKMEQLREQVQSWCADKPTFQRRALHRSPALFEVVFWRRVVFDEFHESEAWEYRVREMLRCLGAVHKWGLSGTPPLGSPLAVAEVAGLLGYAHPSEVGNAFEEALYYAWTAKSGRRQWWFAQQDHQRRLKEMAEGFVEGYIRQNTSELVERIGIVEHEELVEHAPEERLIYRQACHDKGVFDLRAGYAHISLDARAELLKRCAHFDMGEAAESASSAVNTLGELKRERVEKVEQQLWVEVARARLFQAWDPSGKHALRSAGVQHPDAQATVARVLASSVEEVERHLARVASSTAPNSGKLQRSLWTIVTETARDGGQRLRPEVRLDQPVKETEYYRDDRERHAVVHAVVKRAQEREADRVLSDLAVCEQACRGGRDVGTCLGKGLAELAGLVDRAHRSLQFYAQQVRSLTREDAGDEDEPCSICLEGTRDLQTLAILPCSHVFHSECIRAVLAQQPLCPECRTPVQRSQVSSMVMELKPPAPKRDEGVARAANMSVAWKRHGSKLNAVAQRLRAIRQQDPTAKALVFVQWADLEVKVGRALKDHGLPFLRLSDSARTGLGGGDGAVLRRFQEDAGAPFVLVLSLQRAAAGTNLTAASHVLFVHPMNAETVRTAAAYERQALARVRRIGQARKEVHVWRFITKQTVEEHIWRLHRSAHEAEAADGGDE